MYKIHNFTKEQKLLILTSRITMSEENRLEICKILDEGINWFEFYKLTLYHKTFTLCWKNIENVKADVKISKYLSNILKFSYSGIKEQNRLFLNELENVIEALNEDCIPCLPVKGAMLINKMYKEHGIRYMGDIDCLIRYSDIEKIKKNETSWVYTRNI
ncbi:nucleotidyltransferase family protein [Clostridium sp. MSJ-4]|uniref:Nucleotidyltransferase family protein n=1 Tax=Clostridium simiarum TaxID=2841506 RepID=A0ABS6EWW9_9CLOT|nr:nucleotidyltransferase family protein [Clostridium simiarum]MBU5590576.1 nucleotidyltransferase family protein [Clostridium simiarum]